jgi:hypothetical protein
MSALSIHSLKLSKQKVVQQQLRSQSWQMWAQLQIPSCHSGFCCSTWSTSFLSGYGTQSSIPSTRTASSLSTSRSSCARNHWIGSYCSVKCTKCNKHKSSQIPNGTPATCTLQMRTDRCSSSHATWKKLHARWLRKRRSDPWSQVSLTS